MAKCWVQIWSQTCSPVRVLKVNVLGTVDLSHSTMCDRVVLPNVSEFSLHNINRYASKENLILFALIVDKFFERVTMYVNAKATSKICVSAWCEWSMFSKRVKFRKRAGQFSQFLKALNWSWYLVDLRDLWPYGKTQFLPLARCERLVTCYATQLIEKWT